METDKEIISKIKEYEKQFIFQEWQLEKAIRLARKSQQEKIMKEIDECKSLDLSGRNNCIVISKEELKSNLNKIFEDKQ